MCIFYTRKINLKPIFTIFNLVSRASGSFGKSYVASVTTPAVAAVGVAIAITIARASVLTAKASTMTPISPPYELRRAPTHWSKFPTAVSFTRVW